MLPTLIDSHLHAQPSADIGRRFQEGFGFQSPPRSGAIPELLESMRCANIRKSLMVPWMPTGQILQGRLAKLGDVSRRQHEEIRNQVLADASALNQWAVDTVTKNPDQLACLVSLDPTLMTAPELEAEVEDKLSKGAIGLKIAPLFLEARPDDPKLAIIFEQAAKHGGHGLSQAGDTKMRGSTAWGHPQYFEEVLRTWPNVKIQLAHLGMGAEDEVARLMSLHDNLYADTSARLHEVGQRDKWSPADAAECFRRLGIERVLFGTNYPMHDQKHFVDVLQSLPLTDDERERILWKNAAELTPALG